MRIRYVNHLNEELDFSGPPYTLQNLEVFNYNWEVSKTLRRAPKKFDLEVAIKAEAFSQSMNDLFEILEKDVMVKKSGRLFVEDYYLKCYITGSQKIECVVKNGYMRVGLTVQAEYPEWVRETVTSFSQFADSTAEYLDFPFSYSIDYANELLNGIIRNPSFAASNFRLTIYGQISKPTLYIDGHEYSVDVDVAAGEYLTIDSVEKTIILTKNNGEQINCFNMRNRDSYIFEKIPAGENQYSSPNESIYFDVTLLDERSEPKWT